MYIITMDVCLKLGVLKEGEKYTAEDTKTKIIFVVGQWVYMFLMILPVPLYFYVRFVFVNYNQQMIIKTGLCSLSKVLFYLSRFFNTSYLFILILAGIWRGGSYYIFKFSKSYNQKFEMPKKEN